MNERAFSVQFRWLAKNLPWLVMFLKVFGFESVHVPFSLTESKIQRIHRLRVVLSSVWANIHCEMYIVNGVAQLAAAH